MLALKYSIIYKNMHIYTKIFKTIKAVDVYAYKCQKLKSKKKKV